MTPDVIFSFIHSFQFKMVCCVFSYKKRFKEIKNSNNDQNCSFYIKRKKEKEKETREREFSARKGINL